MTHAERMNASFRACEGLEDAILEDRNCNIKAELDTLDDQITLRLETKTHKTNCAVCGEFKETPLRRDEIGGYVCLSCIDKHFDMLKEKHKSEIAELVSFINKIMECHDEDVGMDDYPDDESVGSQDDGFGNHIDIPLTFGTLREGRKLIAKYNGEGI